MAIWYILTANLAAAVFQTAIPSAAEVQETALLQVEKGQLPLVISAPHGGLQSPEGWEVRTNGVVVRDTNTYQIAESLADAIQLRTGQRPFLVLSKVHRKYLDLNRSLEESGGKSSPEKRRLWNTYHESIERACQQAMTLGKGRALLIDLHGQGHKHGKIELGYGLRASELRQPDSLLPRPGWLRGPQSLGAFLQAQELQCMPSPAHLFPLENEKFFSGGYTIRRHRAQGGLAGSEIGLQAIQIELPPKPRRGNAAERQPLADRLAQGISLFLAAQFSIPKVELLSMAIPNDGPMAVFQSDFKMLIQVWGIPILATSGVSASKHSHAAAVLAEYLDNDEDGVVDDAQVLSILQNQGAFLVMPVRERQMRKFENRWQVWEKHGWDIGQDLYATETKPPGGRFDATLEEVWHLVSNGWAIAYPAVFGIDFEHPSRLTDAMDLARGGRFEFIPDVYPKNAWYTYEDETCDYSCQAMEYFYWALTSLLGGQSAPGRAEEIAVEWGCPSLPSLKKRDPTVFMLLTSAQYSLPTKLPDGKYR